MNTMVLLLISFLLGLFLNENCFSYDHTQHVYVLEYDYDKNHSFITEIPLNSGKKIVKNNVGNFLYNNLTITEDRAYLSMYRTTITNAFGTFPDQGKIVDVVWLDGRTHRLTISGYSPTDVLLIGSKIYIQSILPNGSSGFDTFDRSTLKHQGVINLGDYYPSIDWRVDNNENNLYVFGSSVETLRKHSPFLTIKQKKEKGDYIIFYNIDLNEAANHYFKYTPFEEIGNPLLFKDRFIMSTYSHTTSFNITTYSFKDNKVLSTKKMNLPTSISKYSKKRKEFYCYVEGHFIKVLDSSSFKEKASYFFPGVRDMVIKDNLLFLNQRYITTDLNDTPKISVLNLDTGKIERVIKGIFGPFALIFD